jgi:hypothetical protein
MHDYISDNEHSLMAKDEQIHVVEYSAYLALQKRCELAEKKLAEAIEQRNHAYVCKLDKKFVGDLIRKDDAQLNAIESDKVSE